MTRQNIARGTIANDGTGDTLRDASLKINQNFVELYQKLGGDSDILMPGISFDSNSIIFEGTSADSFETVLTLVNPTADRLIVLPNASGFVILDSATQTLTNKTLTSAVLTTPRINDTSADHRYIFAVSELVADRTITLPLLSGNDTFVFASHAQTLTNKTLASPTIVKPKILVAIDDSAGAEVLAFTSVASAVNEVLITNAATGTGPVISTTGNDTNINLNLSSKGTGAVRLQTKVAYASETLTTASPSVSLLVPLTIFNRAGSIAATLTNGTVTGESKKFVNINTGAATVTPTSFGQGTSFTVNQNGAAEAIWSGSSWYLFGDSNNYVTIT